MVTTITQSGNAITLSAVQERTVVRVRLGQAPASVTLDGTMVPVVYDAPSKTLSVEIAPRPGPAAVQITPS